MAIDWDEKRRALISTAMARFPVSSGRCAALARVVFEASKDDDPDTEGLQVVPRNAARYVVPKHPEKPRWFSHTLVQTKLHRVDALTGVDGCPAPGYLERHWEYPDALDLKRVDLYAIDPDIEDDS